MKLHRFHITPKSAVGSPLKSDTLTGQLLCLYREKHGEEQLEELIGKMKRGYLPFIFSDAFPHNTLPFPALPPITRQAFDKICEKNRLTNKFVALNRQKQFKKIFHCIDVEQWRELRKNLSMEALFEFYLNKFNKSSGLEHKEVVELHNIIDRNTGRTLAEGGLFTTENTWYPVEKQQATLDVYARVQPDFLNELDDLMERLEMVGYGRDASVGKGHLMIHRDACDVSFLDDCPCSNYWLNLSTYSSRNSKDLNGYYRVTTKFGKVWSGFGEIRPFKHPLLVFEAGSVFENTPDNLGNSIIDKVHVDEKIVQCTSPIMIPFVLKESP